MTGIDLSSGMLAEAKKAAGEVGVEVEHIWGGTAGTFGRRPVELDEMEIMIVARKPAAE